MDFNVHCEMPSGMRSKGYDCPTKERAVKVLGILVAQINVWENFISDVVILGEDGKEIVRNAAGGLCVEG